MKKILVPCDFSGTAILAFKFAVNLARKSKAEIILLHIVELPVLRHGPVPINALEKSFLKQTRERIQVEVDKLIDRWGEGTKVRFVLDHGAVIHSISRHTKKHKADLVVMGTHGASGIREFLIGSNAEKIVRFSAVPVITIKKKFNINIKRILFATDLIDLPSKLIDEIVHLQHTLKAELQLVYVNTPANFKTDDALQTSVTNFLHHHHFSKKTSFAIVNAQDEASGIRHFATKNKFDLVAMPTHSWRGLSHLLFGSVAEDTSNHVDCPVWTCSLNVS